MGNPPRAHRRLVPRVPKKESKEPRLDDLEVTSERVIVSAERIVPTDELRGNTLLFSYEVDAVVEAPRGAWPTAVPGLYGGDLEAVRGHLQAAAA